MFTLATSELCQTDLVPSDISRLTGTCQVPVVLLISAFENGTKPVWHGSEVANMNALLVALQVVVYMGEGGDRGVVACGESIRAQHKS